jgi:hypothetical protein
VTVSTTRAPSPSSEGEHAPPGTPAALVAVAVATTVCHLTGLALAAAWIAPGTMAEDPALRAAYLAARPLGWTVGWGFWMASAITLVAFLALVADVRPSSWTRLAVVLAAAAAAVDLSADTLQIVVRPALAAGGATAAFLALEQALDAVGFVAANGLYSTAVLSCAMGLGRAGARRRVVALGTATFLAGLALAGAGFRLHPRALQATAGVTMVAFVAWTVAVALDVRGRTR